MSQEKTQSKSGAMQMVLLGKSFALSGTDIEQKLSALYKGHDVTVQASDNGAFMVQLGGLAFVILALEHAVPSDTFATSLRTSYGLRDGEQIVSNHKAHIIVSSLSSTDDLAEAITIAGNVMRISKALAEDSKPMGYFWSGSETLQGSEQFNRTVNNYEQGLIKLNHNDRDGASLLPATYWIGLRLFSPDQKQLFGATTKGLEFFLGYELELTPLQWAPADIAQRIYGTVSYLYGAGPVLKDGNTLGISESEHFRIRELPATPTMAKRLQLTLESAGH